MDCNFFSGFINLHILIIFGIIIKLIKFLALKMILVHCTGMAESISYPLK